MKQITFLKNILIMLTISGVSSLSAQTTILSEDFSNCFGASVISDFDAVMSTTGWSGENVYCNNGRIKIGTGSKLGKVHTPALDLSETDVTYSLSFKACAWNKDKNFIYVLIDNDTVYTANNLVNDGGNDSGTLSAYSIEIKGTATSTVIFGGATANNGRFFLDDIEIIKTPKGETLPARVLAPANVLFTTTAPGKNRVDNIEITGTNLTSNLAVTVSGENFFCPTITIANIDGRVETKLYITFAPTVAGNHSGTLIIDGGGLKEPVNVELAGASVIFDGEGSKENPYSVSDVLALNNTEKVTQYVKGYIVGYVNGSTMPKDASFIVPAELATNLLLAAEPGITDPEKCITLQLPSGNLRTALNLKDHPENLNGELLICGSLEKYMRICGIKSPSDYILTSTAIDKPKVIVAKTFEIETMEGISIQSKLPLKSQALTADLTISIEGNAFSCETTTLTPEQAANTSLVITFTPEAAGKYNGHLVIKGGGLAENDTIILIGTATAKLDHDIMYSENFTNGDGGFTFANVTLSGEFNDIWARTSNNGIYYLKASGYKNGNNASESWAISPTIDLSSLGRGNTNSARLIFDHAVNYASGNEFTSNLTLWLSTSYTEGIPSAANWEELTIPVYPNGTYWTFISSDSIDLTDVLYSTLIHQPRESTHFQIKENINNVNIAFKYTSTTDVAVTWEITNINIVKYANPNLSGVDAFVIEPSAVITKDGKVIVNATQGGIIEVFNITGEKIYSTQATGIQTITGLNKKQIYIVHYAGKATKVVL